MITQFQEQGLITSPITCKSLQFTSENVLITGSSNRLLEYNLYNLQARPIINSRFNVKYFSIQENNYACVDDQNNILCNSIHISGKNRQIKKIEQSPDGKMIAIAYVNKLIIYNQKMEKIKVHSNKHQIKGIAWSPDSRFILSYGDDNAIIVNAVFSLRLYTDIILQAHKFKIASAFFVGTEYIITIDILGKLCQWKFVQDYLTQEFQTRQKHQKSKNQHHLGIENDQSEYTEDELQYMSNLERNIHKGRFILEKKINIKDLIKHFAQIKSVAYQNKMIIIGMKNGVLTIFNYQPKEEQFLIQIQSFQITQTSIDSLAVNKNGNWIALGMKNKGQLIVWEWRSQSYILNQQSLSYETTCSTINQDIIAIGTQGGIIRLYDQQSNFCIAKFDDQHTSKVTQIKFCPQKNGVLLSCSLDGTIRAFDTIRLKCFRVMQPEIPNQLQCLDVEPSGELVCAGGFDPYEIYVFSLQTGQLVEVISGHQAPIVSLRFINNEEKILLISGSWDKTIRIHDLYARGMKEGSGGDSMLHNSEITALATNDNQIAVATMGGELIVWDIKETQILFSFDIHRDIQGGRLTKESLAAQKNQNLKYFITIQYSKDGQYLIGGGNSKYICLYDMKYRILIRKFVISNNMSLDGMKIKINFSSIDQENRNIEESEEEKDQDNLPGAKTYDVSKRNNKRIPIQVYNIEFTDSNREFIVATCEGISTFGCIKRRQYFDPLDIDESVNIQEIQKSIDQKNYIQALLLSLRLNSEEILLSVFQAIPTDQIIQMIPAIPESLIVRLLETIIKDIQINRSIEIDLIWIKQILIDFAHLIKGPTANRKVQNILQEVMRQIRIDFNRIKDPIRKCINILEYLQN